MSTLKKVVREAEIETRVSQMNKTVNCVEHKDDKLLRDLSYFEVVGS
ncbi:hypothetical protein PC116_g9726 [Phytophthora cactorum]|uniref:Uncharacterized protein n=1 Tax=Phytophthora cactorum TaxID=29920 RepID=A0A329SCR7_9STRA|nr:hypothetical protein Pcac1_g21139 [Phytophthora cactorum]KAG2837525.1 hypothetical protein PC112_g4877 [Phytophthora cactorum]KAG2861534.1 hypothetical protein PC113_g7083 [Phytophthora cactorum]KAG2922580.1 hypothetical protein PC114_g5184 [Phytophthora cactorum]KAG2950166.1 hypothetical protein PC117_g4647 [Phytophthora cactorum]